MQFVLQNFVASYTYDKFLLISRYRKQWSKIGQTSVVLPSPDSYFVSRKQSYTLFWKILKFFEF